MNSNFKIRKKLVIKLYVTAIRRKKIVLPTKNVLLATVTTSQIYLPYGELFYTILESPKTHGYGTK